MLFFQSLRTMSILCVTQVIAYAGPALSLVSVSNLRKLDIVQNAAPRFAIWGGGGGGCLRSSATLSPRSWTEPHGKESLTLRDNVSPC